MPKQNAGPIISLLTDFGTTDHYAGVMKAVILGIAPRARVVDISHEVQPFQIRQGAYLLSQSWRWFPAGSAHVAVVDPGVGSSRRAIAALAEGHFFVLPDNGLLSLIGAEEPIIREIQNEALMLKPVSRTFHGRDIFAPTAAHLASGFGFEEIGPIVIDWVCLSPAAWSVLHIDRFGNVITNVPAAGNAGCGIAINNVLISRHASSYASALTDAELFLIEGSGGYLEVSLREESAADRIGCRVGDPVTLVFEKS